MAANVFSLIRTLQMSLQETPMWSESQLQQTVESINHVFATIPTGVETKVDLMNAANVCGLFIARSAGNVSFSMKINASYFNLTDGVTYRWIASGSGTNEFYCELIAGGDPSIDNPSALIVNSVSAVRGTIGALAAGEFAYGNNDTLGFSTIYLRLTDGSDPDTKASGYVKIMTIPFTIDKPICLYGASTESFLAAKPDSVFITQASGDPLVIEFVVGFDATP